MKNLIQIVISGIGIGLLLNDRLLHRHTQPPTTTGEARPAFLKPKYVFFTPLVLALFFGIACGAAATSTPKVVPPTPNTSPAIIIDGAQLYADYYSNEVAADLKYKGRMVVTSGQVASIGKDFSGKPYIQMVGAVGGVNCSFAPDQIASIAQVSPGQEITVTGTVDGFFVSVQLKGCTIKTPSIPAYAPQATPTPAQLPSAAVSPTPLPTPNIQATVEALVQQRLSKTLTPTPASTPTAIAQGPSTPVPATLTPTLIPTPTPHPTPASPVPCLTPLCVNKTEDTFDGVCDKDCSLRDAVKVARPGENINIPSGTYHFTQGTLVINKDLNLIGAGSETTIVRCGKHGCFTIAGGEVHIRGITISSVDQGINNQGKLTLTDCIIKGIAGLPPGVGISNVIGSLTVNNSIFTANGAGIINEGGEVILANSTISGNSTSGILINSTYRDGQVIHKGTVTVKNSTVSNNGGDKRGGGIRLSNGSLAVLNSTVSGNASDSNGGGIYSQGGTVSLTNTTVTLNWSAIQGGGIYVGGTLQIVNTIIAGNSAKYGPDCFTDFRAAVTSKGHNLLGTKQDCNFELGIGDLLGFNPTLGPLQDNGGPTVTYALLAGSAAIDAGDNSFCPPTDQRGVSRPRGLACDIGAYEFVP
jgi:CSLREA domain-containing protein